jgi:class 3 adenylate cyclase
MQQIADWLKKLGMAQYAQAFSDNDIDFSVLRHLTDQHLKDLGVSLGHRLKMLQAIRDLDEASAAATAPSAPTAELGRQDDAERRQLTVVFCDLVGSTALSTRLDPEDLRAVIKAYHNCVAGIVSRFDGFVAKYMGDGVLVYFGYPKAHEDDAERAVRAALALTEAVGNLSGADPLQVRIGAATGVVVAGDLIGSGEAQERGVVGETPNLAARLQAIAAPNMVVIADTTRRLLGNLFELQDLGALDLKGVAGPVRAWAALRANDIESRFEALHAAGLTVLVGREEESELLLRRWSRAKAGEGQVVLISGEAGIGKSRLTAALLERVAGEPHTRLRYFCSPQHTDSVLHPVIGQMERAAQLAHNDTSQVRLEKLDAVLARTSTSREDAALFAELLSLANDGRYPTLALTPEHRRQRTLEAFVSQLEALTCQNPVLGAAIGREFSHALLAAVVSKPEAELASALDRLVTAGLLFRQGVPPHASYLFKHALVQDAAYGTLLREPRRSLHARIAAALESQFPEIAENQAELLAHHCSEAGLIEKAAGLWGKAGHQSLMRSALVEASEQLTRALTQIATAPSTAALRREQIRLQVALITPLVHVKGYAAPETRAATERARLLIDQAEALGEPPEDPLLLFTVLYGYWVGKYIAFNGGAMRELAAQFLALAQQNGTPAPLLIAHRIMGISLMCTGNVAQARTHLDSAITHYDPPEHRPLAVRFGHDSRVAVLSYRSWTLWMLGYPDAALADAEHALKDAREIGQAATLAYALTHVSFLHMLCGDYALAAAQSQQLFALAEDKGAWFWRPHGMMQQGCVHALTGHPSEAVQMLAAGITAYRSTGSNAWFPWFLSHLSRAYAELGQSDDAWRCIDEAMAAVETTDERWCEAEIYLMASEIALLPSEGDHAKAEGYLGRALAVAREQRTKSWELRAALGIARLWRDQGKSQQAHELLAPVYGWFTEGFGTLDLKNAKALLDQLA